MRICTLILFAIVMLAGVASAEDASPCMAKLPVTDEAIAEYLGITQVTIDRDLTGKGYTHVALVAKLLGGEDGALVSEAYVGCGLERPLDRVRCMVQIPRSDSPLRKALDDSLPFRLSVEMFAGERGEKGISESEYSNYFALPEDFFEDRSGSNGSGGLHPRDSKMETLPSGAKVVPLYYFLYPKEGRNGKGGGSITAQRRDNPGAYILLVYLVMDDKEIEREDTLGDFEAMASNKE